MKVIVLMLFFIRMSTLYAESKCYIKTYPKIFKVSKDIPFSKNNLLIDTNCSKKIQNHFFRTIGNLEGAINAERLQVMISNNLKISPKKIDILSIETHLKEKLNISNQQFIRNFKFTQKRKYLPLINGESLSVSCDTCEFLGHKSVKLIKGASGSMNNKYFWAEIDLLMEGQSLKAKSTLIVNNKPLSSNDFEKALVYTQHPERFFIKEKSLKYYKLNRPLREGESLKFNALSPVHLVRPGVLVSIELNEKGIKLSGKALATRAGKLGEIIQLTNQKTRRPILGKVIDYNKVMVEL